jgi:arsenate reductase (glutaredoxin)
MIIYYNPQCSKCREARELLEESNCSIEIREYLKDPPSPKELRELLGKLGLRPRDIVRTTEPLFIEEYEGKQLSDAAWIRVLSRHPVLIERPIVIDGEKAVIGRPPVVVLDLLKTKKGKKLSGKK